MPCFHHWKLMSKDAVGYFRKQEGYPESDILVPGTVFKCAKCKKMIIEPEDLKLKVVEIEPNVA